MEGCAYIHPVIGEKCNKLAHMAHHCVEHCTVDIIVAWYEKEIKNLEDHNDELISNLMSLEETISELRGKQRRSIKQWIKDKISNW